MKEPVSDAQKLHKLVSKIIAGIIAKEENFLSDEIDPNHGIMTHYDLDSLSFISKLMAIGDYFELEIDDGKLNENTTINELTDFVIDNANENLLSQIKSDTDVNKALLTINIDDTDAVKQIRHIFLSPFFTSLQTSLGLNVNSVFVTLSKLLRNNKIEHIAVVPKYTEDKLDLIYIGLLTKKQLYYIILSNCVIEFKEISLSQLNIESKFCFQTNGEILKLEIACDVGDFDDKGKPIKYKYTLVGDYVETTIKLISKINKFKEEIYAS